VRGAFNLGHFVTAQNPVYEHVLAELRAGRKQSHWMWFVFPQIAGLGHSVMAETYAIRSLDEAKAYHAHPVLGARLKECTELVLNIDGRSVREIFGAPDDLKFRSSMTLFARATPDEPLFGDALARYFGGKRDDATERMLRVA